MSMIYKEGTASLTKGSPVLKGKDTYFLNPIFNVGVGQIVQVKSGDNVYVNSIKEVVDNETLILSFDSLQDVTDGEIVIMITMVDSISDTANKLLGMTRGLVQFETEMTKWFTSMDKKITITLPDGTKKEVYTLQAIMEQVAQNEKEMQELLQNSEKKVNDMVDKAQTDVNQVVTDGTNKINQAVDKADKEVNEAITSGTGKIDTMLTESQKKIDKTIEDTEVKVDTELGKIDEKIVKIDEKIGNQIDGKVDKTGDIMTGSLITKGYLKSDGGEVNASEGSNSIAIVVQNGVQQIVTKTGDSGYIRNTLPGHNGKLLSEGDFGIGGRQTLGDNDLNDVKIPGDYQQDRSSNATKENNYPINTAGFLSVKQTINGWGNGCIQQYHIYSGVGYFQRTWNGSDWSSWDRFVSEKSPLITSIQDDIGKKFDKSGGLITGRTAIRARIGEKLALHDTLSQSANYLSFYSGEPEKRDSFFGFGMDNTKSLTIRNDRDNANLIINSGGLAHNGTSVILQGDYGVGSRSLQVLQDFRVPGGSGLYRYTNNTKNIPGQMVNNPFGDVLTLQYDGSHNYQSLIFGNFGEWLSLYRVTNGTPYTAQVMTSNMWTVDNNGFYKKSSPIIEIRNDGSFKINDESNGAIVKRLNEGVYYITGVVGLHSDKSWGGSDGGFEIPLDNNKLPMIWVDYEVESDGSIILKTYHREHKDVPPFARNLKRGYKDGDPCDIPKGRFVSVRVNMPEDSIYNKKVKEESDLMKEMESNPFYKEERAFPNIIFNKKGDL